MEMEGKSDHGQAAVAIVIYFYTNGRKVSLMGRGNAKYKKDLHQQAYDTLTGMLAFGESKKEAVANDVADDKIFSKSTYKTYWKHIKYFTKWVQAEHPDVTTLKKAKKLVPEWLQSRVDQVNAKGEHLSAWTINTEAAALNKLFQIKPDDPKRFQPPKRHREEIKRSRTDAVRDKHFSVTNNAELIKFCKGTGLRRAGVESVKGRDLMSKDQIEATIKRIEEIPADNRTAKEQKMLTICLDTRNFTDPSHEYFVHTKEKGGRERISPIIGPDAQQIIDRFKATKPDEKVWLHVNKNADIHGYRGDYATAMYKMYARDIKDIPYDKVNKGTGRAYQSEVYTCRKDESGKKLDKKAMLICSKALGHNRIEVVANNYIRGL